MLLLCMLYKTIQTEYKYTHTHTHTHIHVCIFKEKLRLTIVSKWIISTIEVHGDPDKKNVIFVKYCSLYIHNTDCKPIRLNATETPLFSHLKCEKNEKKSHN